MSCVNCAARIEKGLREKNGVSSATVNFAISNLLVEYDEKMLSTADIEEGVKHLGYGVERGSGSSDKETEELLRERSWLIFSLITATIIMSTMLIHDNRAVGWLNLILATLIQFTAGLTFYRGSWYTLKNGSANMDLLVALGTSAAYFYSLAAFFAGWHGGVFFETSAMLIAFIRLGKYLEGGARGRASRALRELLNLQPPFGRLLTESGEEEIPANLIKSGDLLLVRPGESFPVDGEIIEGTSDVDEAIITGESMPVLKSCGDRITGGAINLSALLQIRATAVGEETALARIVRMVQEAQSDKAPIQRFADMVSARFVPLVLLISIVTFFGWYLLTSHGALFAFKLAVAVMVIACPCAMGLATPTAIMAGSGVGLANGILVRRGSVLEHISRINMVMLDKTGTITVGKPLLTDFEPVSAIDGNLFLEKLAASSAHSLHPLSVAACAAAADKEITFGAVSDYEEFKGRGVSCRYGTAQLIMGNRRLLEERGIDTLPLHEAAEKFAARGASTVWLASDGVLAGIAAFSDQVKSDAREAIRVLRQYGITCIMLTGDNSTVAAAVAKEVALDGYLAELLPEQKLEAVKAKQSEGFRVAMVGDGINDAPSLAAADVGIAIGSGTDVAKETGDIVLVRNSLMDVARAIMLGRKTLAKVKQNLFWALFYNCIGIPVAAGALYPAFAITLKPEYAGLAMALSSVSVVTNSLLLKRERLSEIR